MAGVCPLDTSFTQNSEEVEFQIRIFKIIKTSKKKILFYTMDFTTIICVIIKIRLRFLNVDT